MQNYTLFSVPPNFGASISRERLENVMEKFGGFGKKS
jgi:hypothetical protein